MFFSSWLKPGPRITCKVQSESNLDFTTKLITRLVILFSSVPPKSIHMLDTTLFNFDLVEYLNSSRKQKKLCPE